MRRLFIRSCFLLVIATVSRNVSARPLILCSTTDLAAVVLAVGGEAVRVEPMIPYAVCPGHVDLRPSQWQRVRDADLVLARGFEALLPAVRQQAGSEKVILIEASGHWMAPQPRRHVARSVFDCLQTAFPDLKTLLNSNLTAYMEILDRLDRDLQRVRVSFENRPVVSDRMNAHWMQSLGFTVVGELLRDEAFSPARYEALVGTGRDNKAEMVIANLQSAGRIPEQLAREIGVPFVVLSNFPQWPPSAEAAKAPVAFHVRESVKILQQGLSASQAPEEP